MKVIAGGSEPESLPVFSPTETDDYLLCPRLRVLKRTWQPRGGEWRPHMALGTAVHAGLATHYNGHTKEALDDALETLAQEFVEGSEWTIEGLQKLVTKGLAEGLKTPLVSDEGSVVGVEMWASRCKVDLVTREPFGLVVTDHKASLDLDKRRLDYKVRELDPSWQLLHEAWAVRNHYGETPRWARGHIIAIGPRSFSHIHSIEITDARLNDWEASASVQWQRMFEDAEYAADPGAAILPPMNTRSCWQYGRKCDFYDACHVFMGDTTKFDTLYEPIGDAR